MASLQVIPGPGVDIPKENKDGSYSLFAPRDIGVDAGQTETVDMGIMISLPFGYKSEIQSCSYVEANRTDILMSSFNNLQYERQNLSSYVNEIGNLRLTFHNFGKSTWTVHKGQELARMWVVKTFVFPIRMVDKIQEEINPADLTKERSYEPRTLNGWLAKNLSENAETFLEKYVTEKKEMDSIVQELQTLFQTNTKLKGVSLQKMRTCFPVEVWKRINADFQQLHPKSKKEGEDSDEVPKKKCRSPRMEDVESEEECLDEE